MSYEVFGEPPEPGRCHCGHALDEHGDDPDHPGSMACNAPDCDCIAFEESDDSE